MNSQDSAMPAENSNGQLIKIAHLVKTYQLG